MEKTIQISGQKLKISRTFFINDLKPIPTNINKAIRAGNAFNQFNSCIETVQVAVYFLTTARKLIKNVFIINRL